MPSKTIFPAKFISFEGIDGCGKSTLLEHLSQRLQQAGQSFIQTREPGGTLIGENIRRLLLDPTHRNMDQLTEVFLYTASRAQLTRDVIVPALQEGRWVLADRYIDATLAYQGFGRGLDRERLRRLQEWATGDLWPHHTILLDCTVAIAWERMKNRLENSDRIEQEHRTFHEKVRQGYLELARSEPGRFIVLDAGKRREEVVADFDRLFWEPMADEYGSAAPVRP